MHHSTTPLVYAMRQDRDITRRTGRTISASDAAEWSDRTIERIYLCEAPSAPAFNGHVWPHEHHAPRDEWQGLGGGGVITVSCSLARCAFGILCD